MLHILISILKAVDRRLLTVLEPDCKYQGCKGITTHFFMYIPHLQGMHVRDHNCHKSVLEAVPVHPHLH
jgi:hypothetical protein